MRLTALILAACTAMAAPPPAAALDAAAQQTLLAGPMKRFVFATNPAPVPLDAPFADVSGTEARLADFAGQPVLLNFWATWCAPCRAEMPSLDRLQTAMGDSLKVVTLATGRNRPEAVTRFFAETGVTALPSYLDPHQDVSRQMGVLGLPVSVLIGADGVEIGRLIGDAEWDSPEALALIRAATAP